ncbi:N-acetyltransferase [Halobacteriales archaeon SW_12_67_38]|jgi:ribosomal protein S18 acetylase RimI-like enzyme|nr:MAG: N-acetyltransferase [Halobacteriales archaeon SW_12_67_38]
MDNASIRPATAADVPGIQGVARRAWPATYDEFLAEAAIDAILDDWYATDEVETAITAERSVYLVAEDEGIAGYASAAPIDAGGDEREAQLYAIYVDPDRWGEDHASEASVSTEDERGESSGGIGTALLDGIVDRLAERDVDRLRVEVLADNTVGVSFYESRRFERTTERERTVGDQALPEYVYYRDL